MISVYNLRAISLGYRVIKFTDGEPEGSYHTSHAECDCPAGSRPSCRHRQMLPRMLTANLLDSPAFWNHDRNQTCDIDGRAMALPKGPEIESNVDRSLIESASDDSFREHLHKAGKVPRHLHPQEVHTSKNPWRRI